MNEENMKEVIYNDSLTAREKYKMLYGEDVSRDRARHTIDKMKRQFQEGSVLKASDTVGEISVCNMHSDGTASSERLLSCSDDDLHNPEFLLKAHGYDPSHFVLVQAQSSIWNGLSADGKKMYSSRIRVKPCGADNDPVRLLENALAAMKVEPKEESRYVHTVKSSDKMLEVCLPDLHIGLSEEHVGLDYLRDYVSLKDIASDTVSLIKHNKISNCTLAFLGDILHYDTAGKTTTGGTQQCSNESFQEMYNRAVRIVSELVSDVIETLQKIDKDNYVLNIVYVPGNHDRILGYTLMCVMRALFDGKARFVVDQTDRKLFKFGCNLIGYTHGEMPKGRISQWVYTDGRPYLKDVEEIEVHCGHLHSEQVTEENGMIVRHLPTLAGVSPWEYKNGYVSNRRIAAFIWDHDYGLQSINYIGV